MTDRLQFDGVLIIGAGLAGLSAALAAAPRQALVLSAAPLGSGCSSAWAQGGMAAALSQLLFRSGFRQVRCFGR